MRFPVAHELLQEISGKTGFESEEFGIEADYRHHDPFRIQGGGCADQIGGITLAAEQRPIAGAIPNAHAAGLIYAIRHTD